MAAEIVRGTTEGVNGPSQTLDVRLDRDPTSLLVDVPLLGDVYMDWITAGTRVLVAVFDDNQAHVLGPIKNPTQLLLSSFGFQTTNQAFTSTSYTAHTGCLVTLVPTAPAFLVLFFSAAGSCTTARSSAVGMRINISPTYGTTHERVFAAAVANYPAAMVYQYRKWVVAGTYTVDVQFRVKNSGDTFNIADATFTGIVVPT